ncbi:hypothetical protein BZA77DRAFT_355521 [Pyronema omphalodes]|nr:hypothetical protein BZA77DRAFT_355521 [Pyronema omphalodes]
MDKMGAESRSRSRSRLPGQTIGRIWKKETELEEKKMRRRRKEEERKKKRRGKEEEKKRKRIKAHAGLQQYPNSVPMIQTT